MEIATKTNGVVDVSESQIVTFSDGLMGFERFKRYALLDSEYEPFVWMQSVEDANLAFLLVDPFLICGEYEADIDDAVLRRLDVQSPEDIVVMTIVTIPSDGSRITANFLGPVVINRRNNQCAQVVLTDSRWTTKYDIIDALKRAGV
ncbi:MAG: flagellar assembly protein FliW [Treponemataceae bacterium]|nr:flagellar assembly protein FliW [Treponemataceae bacterium]